MSDVKVWKKPAKESSKLKRVEQSHKAELLRLESLMSDEEILAAIEASNEPEIRALKIRRK